jgi:MFS family permease
MSSARATALLLNLGHALDHLFLLIFATAVAAIAASWHMAWEDLMPYTAPAFELFGLGSLPSGRLGDLWGRRAMTGISLLTTVFVAFLPGRVPPPAAAPAPIPVAAGGS